MEDLCEGSAQYLCFHMTTSESHADDVTCEFAQMAMNARNRHAHRNEKSKSEAAQETNVAATSNAHRKMYNRYNTRIINEKLEHKLCVYYTDNTHTHFRTTFTHNPPP